jgi:hypothetical protein
MPSRAVSQSASASPDAAKWSWLGPGASPLQATRVITRAREFAAIYGKAQPEAILDLASLDLAHLPE